MSKRKTSETICVEVKAQILLDILKYILDKKDLSSDVCDIYKMGTDGWSVVEVKTKILGLRMPDIPYMQIVDIGKHRWKFKFDLSSPLDAVDSSIIRREDLKQGEKVLLLTLTNMSSGDENKYWSLILDGIPGDVMKDLLRKLK